MNLIIIICVIALIIVMLLIWTSIVYNEYQKQKIKIVEAENDINNLLRNEFDVLNSIGIIISSNYKEEPFNDLNELKEMKLSNFELNRKLKEYISELCKYKEKYSKMFRENDELIKLNDSLTEIEENIEGSQEYYNDSVIKYNKSISTFPNILIAKITRQQEKKLYDKLESECKL